MFRIEGLCVWILAASAQCICATTTESYAATKSMETTSTKIANELKNNWHGDMSYRNYESAMPSSDFYLKQILKQLTLLNKKFDRMMIRMVGSTVRDEDYNDRNVRRIEPNYTQPDCESLIGTGHRSGIYHFARSPRKDIEWIWNIYAIYCDQSAGGGWTVIQNRMTGNAGLVSFIKSWEDYAKGFGTLDGEFWLGNEWIHRLTTFFGPYELRIELKDWNNSMWWAQYTDFKIGPKEENYRLVVDGYTGNATDSLSNRKLTAFSTYDHINEVILSNHSCTSSIGGGWWYLSDCIHTNLNSHNDGIKSTKMMIRLKNLPSLDTARTENER